MATTLKSAILKVTRRTKKGLTAGEIFDRVLQTGTAGTPVYSTVRARVYELADAGELQVAAFRPDSHSGRTAAAFVRASH